MCASSRSHRSSSSFSSSSFRKTPPTTTSSSTLAATGERPVSYFNVRRRGFEPAVEAAGLAGKGITLHSLRHAALSLYASAGQTLVEVASIVGHADASVTAEVYARLFERSDVEVRARAAQSSLSE